MIPEGMSVMFWNYRRGGYYLGFEHTGECQDVMWLDNIIDTVEITNPAGPAQ